MKNTENVCILALQDTKVGTIIATVNATDADAGANSDITYSIISGNTDDAFELDSLTGTLKTARPLDYETTQEYEVNSLPLFIFVLIEVR